MTSITYAIDGTLDRLIQGVALVPLFFVFVLIAIVVLYRVLEPRP